MASSSPDLFGTDPIAKSRIGTRLRVLVPLPLAGPLDYLADQPFAPGDLVAVPVGSREVIGCVWDSGAEEEAEAPRSRLRRVLRRVDSPPLPGSLRRFIDWVADYTLSPPGMVLAMAIRAHPDGAARIALGWRRTEKPSEEVKLTPGRRAVLDALGTEAMTTADLSAASGASAAVIRGMGAAGLLKEVPVSPASRTVTALPEAPLLSDAQAAVAARLRARVAARRFEVTLLEGVTGSGKTEVYFEAVSACIEEGRQTLVLLPEIALSAQWIDRFTRRFGFPPAVWHSELGPGRRRETWRSVAEGRARVVVGARSALFLPFADLGLVVADEEHEGAFKQEEGVIYHGRDMAVVRARLSGAPAVLVSATPSLESLANAESGRYRHEVLTARHGGAAMPVVSVVDMKADPPERGAFLSSALCTAIGETLARGEQAMLFLNRRGYAPLTLCRACGHRMECPNCSSWLVEHRARHSGGRGVLTCHHCGHVEPLPEECPHCHAEDSLVPVGPGIERVTEEVHRRFPQARVLVMSSDTLGTPSATAEAVRRIADGEVDLVIGTQVVAKGWHFPKLTLVGVVDADLSLGGADLRAAERTVQLLHQVAGRAGREERPGAVLLQSYAAGHPALEALVSNDFRAFMDREAAIRRPSFWPPYGRLAAIVVSASNAQAADALARELAVAAPQGEGIEVLGPAPAPLSLLRGRHRRRLLLRTRRGVRLQPILREWLGAVRPRGDARIEVDVDPVSFM